MSKTDDDSDRFSYDGYLLFNKICTARVREDGKPFPNHVNEAEAELLDKLPSFSIGNPHDPGKGYERSLIRDYINDGKFANETKEFLQSLAAFQFKRETFNDEIGFIEGERKKVDIATESHSNIFWARNYNGRDDDTGYMLFQGSQSDAKKGKGQTQTATGDRLSIQSLTFSHQFLLWIFEKAHNGGELRDNLKIESLTNAGVTGEEDLYGGEAEINNSNDIKRSDPLLLGLLRNKKFEKLEGDFKLDFTSSNSTPGEILDSALLRAEIQPDKIHVKASKAGLVNANKIEKMGLATHFGMEFADLYQHWDQLPIKQKYVSPKFIVELVNTCLDRDVGFNRTPEQVLKKQASKRDEDLSDLDLSLS